jgi:lysyl-tRNA synthetase class 2
MSRQDEIRNARIAKKNNLESQGINPYPADVKKDFDNAYLEKNFSKVKREKAGKNINLAGRIMSIRGSGKIAFVEFYDGTGRFQSVLKLDETGKKQLEFFKDNFDIGDFAQFTGTLFVTKTKQKSLLVKKTRMLTKSLLPLPEKWHGIKNDEERYRKRYLDMVMNPEVVDMIKRKALFWQTARNFFINQDFIEVETPTLEVTTGGAEARPFQTHHHDFDMDVFMRISVGELWQKRLMAAGLPKTFEIGRVYRNEGTSPEHAQEFTNLEFYWAYADYQDGMKLVTRLYRELAKKVYGTTKFTTRGHSFDLADTWKVIDYRQEIKKKTKIDILTATEKEMKLKLKELGVQFEGANKERLTDTLWKYCRKKISGPAFLVGHPKLVSPLSKPMKDNSDLTQRFQVILAGSEVGNGFSELNDPIDQKERFDVQQDLIDRGDDEAMMADDEFIEMLEHGMPPACGFGFGERLFGFFENKTLRETQTFPLMKPEQEVKKDKDD